MLTPLLEDLDTELEAPLDIVKIDVDACPDVASKYQIQSIPALKLFHQGQVVAEHLGLPTTDQLQDLVKPHLQ